MLKGTQHPPPASLSFRGNLAVVALRTGGMPVASSADDAVKNRGHDLGWRLPAFANCLADQKQG